MLLLLHLLRLLLAGSALQHPRTLLQNLAQGLLGRMHLQEGHEGPNWCRHASPSGAVAGLPPEVLHTGGQGACHEACCCALLWEHILQGALQLHRAGALRQPQQVAQQGLALSAKLIQIQVEAGGLQEVQVPPEKGHQRGLVRGIANPSHGILAVPGAPHCLHTSHAW